MLPVMNVRDWFASCIGPEMISIYDTDLMAAETPIPMRMIRSGDAPFFQANTYNNPVTINAPRIDASGIQ
ncbi:hypothetical protein D3C73_1544280 [compost metagenome]